MIHSFTSKDSISREDFAVTLYKGLVQKSQEAFEDAFDLFHPSGTGTMTQAELQAALQKLDEQVTEDEVAEMLEVASTKTVCEARAFHCPSKSKLSFTAKYLYIKGFRP